MTAVTTPVMRIGNALVISEGSTRITWQEENGDWTPVGLWPSAQDRALIGRHLADGSPLLVLLEAVRTTVPLLREEWCRAPRTFRALLDSSDTDMSGEVIDLTVPLLDWLPDHERSRGVDFLAESDKVLSEVPLALLPPLFLERAPATNTPVRFARRFLPTALGSGRLTSAVRHVFDPGCRAACPTAPHQTQHTLTGAPK